MSRKLDAMFAERVLGDPIPDWQCESNLKRSSPGRGWVCVSDPWESVPDWRPAKFTSSLDAAWAGVEKLTAVDAAPVSVGDIRLNPCQGDHEVSIRVWDDKGPDEGRLIEMASDTHVADALVACLLLAFGVSAEEIDSCA